MKRIKLVACRSAKRKLSSETVLCLFAGFKALVIMYLKIWFIAICIHVACVGFSYQEEQDNSKDVEGRLHGLLELFQLPRSSSDWGAPGNPDDDPSLAKGN